MILPSQIKKVDGSSSLPHSAPQKSILRDLLGGSLGFVVFFVVLGILLLFGLSRVHAATNSSYQSGFHLTDRVVVPNSSLIKLQRPVSWNLWVKTPNSMPYQVIFSTRETGGYTYVIVQSATGDGHLYTGISGAVWLLKSDDVLTNNVWHMITVVNSSNFDYLYIDGILNDSVADVGLQYYDTTQSIGNFGGNNEAFNGLIDDFTYFNTALNQTDINKLYAAGAGYCFSLDDFPSAVASYHFDEAAGPVAVDWISSLDATLTTEAWGENKVVCAPPPPPTCLYVPPENCEYCMTQSSCWNTCGFGRWYENTCHEQYNAGCEFTENFYSQLDTRAKCLVFTETYWDCETETGTTCCKEMVNCPNTFTPPPATPPPAEYTATTSTIQFVYSDYTDKWSTPTKLFSEIIDVLGKLVNPVLVWANNFQSFFSVDNAKSQAELLAGSTRTLLVQTKAFDNIFGNFPITGGIAFLVLVILVKGFFVISTKIASFIRR